MKKGKTKKGRKRSRFHEALFWLIMGGVILAGIIVAIVCIILGTMKLEFIELFDYSCNVISILTIVFAAKFWFVAKDFRKNRTYLFDGIEKRDNLALFISMNQRGSISQIEQDIITKAYSENDSAAVYRNILESRCVGEVSDCDCVIEEGGKFVVSYHDSENDSEKKALYVQRFRKNITPSGNAKQLYDISVFSEGVKICDEEVETEENTEEKTVEKTEENTEEIIADNMEINGSFVEISCPSMPGSSSEEVQLFWSELETIINSLCSQVLSVQSKVIHIYYAGPVAIAFFIANLFSNRYKMFIYHYNGKEYLCAGEITKE